MHYTVDPGLYALGNPGPDDPVFVSANYKLSFDRLREALPGRNGWILVLDTKGINVWCAAGKGTFGTEEILQRISSSNLEKVVNHHTLILPQLAGPGVAAFEVKKRSGFRVVYGPVQASDIPAFLDAGLEATPAMRTKTFTAGERLVLVPVELMGAIKIGILVLTAMFVISFFLSGTSVGVAFRYTYNAALALLLGILAGAFFMPFLLPWLPGRSFSVKGTFSRHCRGSSFFCNTVEWRDRKRGIRVLCVASRNTGCFNLPCHELYRFLNVYVPFRCQEGDAKGGATPDCRGDMRSCIVDQFIFYPLRRFR